MGRKKAFGCGNSFMRGSTSPQYHTEYLSIYPFELESLNYIFCSDPYLHQINVQYLDHDTYTDIITFDNAEEENTIESDIFISIDRVKENAASFDAGFEQELRRVMAHGVLHLLGFGDKTETEKQIMREQEEKWVSEF